MREGGLGAPVRQPIVWEDPDFYDPDKIEAEMKRVFDICHGCRRCFNLCDSFPRLFDMIDESSSGEIDGVDYHFVSREEFLRMRAARGFLEANEVHGNWYGSPRDQVREALVAGRDGILKIDVQGAQVVKELTPAPGERVMPKRRFSAFFGTDLDLWLREQGIEEVRIVGVCTNICVLYSAADARMRGYEVSVPENAVASFDQRAHEGALRELADVLKAHVEVTN